MRQDLDPICITSQVRTWGFKGWQETDPSPSKSLVKGNKKELHSGNRSKNSKHMRAKHRSASMILLLPFRKEANQFLP